MLWEKRNQNQRRCFVSIPRLRLNTGNIEKALKMSQSVSCLNMSREIVSAVLVSWGKEEKENAERQMLTITNKGLFTWRFSCPKLPLPTCLSVRECAGPAAKTSLQDAPALLNRSALRQTRHRRSLWGEPIVLKAAELVEHHPVVKKHSHRLLGCVAVFIFLSLCGRLWEALMKNPEPRADS